MIIVAATLVLAPTAQAAPNVGGAVEGPTHIPGELIVGYDPGTSLAARRSVRADEGSSLIRRLLVPRVELVQIAQGQTVEEARADYEARPDVAFAEPNGIVRTTETLPNDP